MNWWQLINKPSEVARRLRAVFDSGQTVQAGRAPTEEPMDKQQAQPGMRPQVTSFYTPVPVSKWDAFIDGFNRLPRPLLTMAIVGFFVIAPLYPDEFLKIASAYEKLPNGFWALLSVVVGFYFTGRMQSKRHAVQVHETLEQVVRQAGNKNNVNAIVADDPVSPGIEEYYNKKTNQAIEKWKKERRM